MAQSPSAIERAVQKPPSWRSVAGAVATLAFVAALLVAHWYLRLH